VGSGLNHGHGVSQSGDKTDACTLSALIKLSPHRPWCLRLGWEVTRSRGFTVLPQWSFIPPGHGFLRQLCLCYHGCLEQCAFAVTENDACIPSDEGAALSSHVQLKPRWPGPSVLLVTTSDCDRGYLPSGYCSALFAGSHDLWKEKKGLWIWRDPMQTLRAHFQSLRSEAENAAVGPVPLMPQQPCQWGFSLERTPAGHWQGDDMTETWWTGQCQCSSESLWEVV
jgi:hypothetical protein